MRGSSATGLALVWIYCLAVGASLGLTYLALPDAGYAGLFLLVAAGNAALAIHFRRLDTE